MLGDNLQMYTNQLSQQESTQQPSQQYEQVLAEDNKIHVIVRVRPYTDAYQMNHPSFILNKSSGTLMNQSTLFEQVNSINPNIKKCILDIKEKTTILIPGCKAGQPESFKYDYVGSEDVTQEEIFQTVGRPIVDQCLMGYNGSILAYGQTGSGKTFTIQGPASLDTYMSGSNYQNKSREEMQKRGLLPRCFEYLFQQINRIKSRRSGKNSFRKSSARSTAPTFEPHQRMKSIEVEVTCSYLEIYNETIFDLLDSKNHHNKIQIHENEKGVYAEPVKKEPVSCIDDVMTLISQGSTQRKIASTHMNKESSRSHAVFSAVIQVIQILDDDQKLIKTSRFHIVDLAGSERCKDTGAAGVQLKEASMINKSLSTLGSVINDLTSETVSKLGRGEGLAGGARFVRYRDSKLTFLLKDSLGGNSKTVMICNINPHFSAFKETRSTLQFASRAKLIKNKAQLNEEINSAQYWKEKYLTMVKQFQDGSISLANKAALQNNNDTSRRDSILTTEPRASYQSVRGGDAVHSDVYGQSSSKCTNCQNLEIKCENLLSKNLTDIQTLTEQFKNQTEIREGVSDAYQKLIDQIQSVREDYQFRMKLLKSKLDRLTEQARQKATVLINSTQSSQFQQELEQMTSLVSCLKEELDQANHKAENERKKELVQWTERVRLLENERAVMESENIMSDRLQTMLLQVERIAQKLVDQKALSSPNMIRNSSRPRESFMQVHQDLNKVIDVEMIDSGANSHVSNNIMMDTTSDTQRKDVEIANLKAFYEEKIETLKTQLYSKSHKHIKNMLQQYSKHIQQTEDEPDNSQKVREFLSNTTNFLLNSQLSISEKSKSQRQEQSQQQIFSPSHSACVQSKSSSDKPDQMSQQQYNHTLDQAMELLEDVQRSLDMKTHELEESRAMLLEMNEECTRLKIVLDTDESEKYSKKQHLQELENRLKLKEDTIEQLNETYEDLSREIHRLSQIERQYVDIKERLRQTEAEVEELRKVNEYFETNALPELNKAYNQLIQQLNLCEQENQNLKAMNQDKSSQELISQLQSQKAEAEQHFININEMFLKTMQTLDQQKESNMVYQARQIQDEQQIRELEEDLRKARAELEDQREGTEEINQALLLCHGMILENNQHMETQEFKQRALIQEKEELVQKHVSLNSRIGDLENDLAQARGIIQDLGVTLDRVREQLAAKTIEHQHVKERLVSYQSMYNITIAKQEEAVERMKKRKSGANENLDKIDNVLQTNKELKEKLRDQENENVRLKTQIRAFEQIKEKAKLYVESQQRINNLEMENVNLKANLEMERNQIQQLQSITHMKENTIKEQKEKIDRLHQETTSLMTNDQMAKFSHYAAIKKENTDIKQEFSKLQQQLSLTKNEFMAAHKKIKAQAESVVSFAKMVFEKLGAHKVPCKFNPNYDMEKFLTQDVFEVITQRMTNLKLQLESSESKLSNMNQQNNLGDTSGEGCEGLNVTNTSFYSQQDMPAQQQIQKGMQPSSQWQDKGRQNQVQAQQQNRRIPGQQQRPADQHMSSSASQVRLQRQDSQRQEFQRDLGEKENQSLNTTLNNTSVQFAQPQVRAHQQHHFQSQQKGQNFNPKLPNRTVGLMQLGSMAASSGQNNSSFMQNQQQQQNQMGHHSANHYPGQQQQRIPQFNQQSQQYQQQQPVHRTQQNPQSRQRDQSSNSRMALD